MRISRLIAALVCALPGAAAAQPLAQSPTQSSAQSPSTEKVIVTAPSEMPDAIIHDFVQSYTAASPANGKVARWRAGICPVTAGLPQAANKLITDRVRQIAVQAGAPVGADACKPNIDIILTFHPQALLDGIRTKTPILLGYHDLAAAPRLATVKHPVQAWYTTQTVGLTGDVDIDSKQNVKGIWLGPSNYLPNAREIRVTGNHLDDGVSSELYHVVVVVDLAKVNGRTLGALADHVAMLSLAQTEDFEPCQSVASITNLVSSGCNPTLKTDQITAIDLAYLHGLYRIDPRKSFGQQKSDIAYEIKKSSSH